ncbi:MAG: Enoyl-(acyl-carrier-protein) reductase (NADH) FabI [Syntrophorhabdus sp. PtaU1.Bin153]|nr:MAG: Enoyl-(acyl-carrier-protein) reductase (NADH) FabI [Syntrophorhabdus sp. PtaU1.Bin153]
MMEKQASDARGAQPISFSDRIRSMMMENGRENIPALLEGKRGLILGIANERSIAYGCAEVFHVLGAELAVTYAREKSEPFVKPLAEKLKSPIFMICNVEIPGQMEAVFERVSQVWGKLDFVLHSIAYAPKEDLHCRVTDCSREGFLQAMAISCYSLIHTARLAEPLMEGGGSILTVTSYGSEKVMKSYNITGPVKAALESCVRYIAAELGPKMIRVNSLSPGAIATRASSGLEHFDALAEHAVELSPQHRLVTIEDVGAFAAFLVCDAAKSITGGVHYIDGGYHIVG